MNQPQTNAMLMLIFVPQHVLQHHGYATELPVGPETPRPSRLPYAREKNAKHHFVPPATPDIEVEVSEVGELHLLV